MPRFVLTQSGMCAACDVWCKCYRQKTYRLCSRCHFLWHQAGCPNDFRAPRGKRGKRHQGRCSTNPISPEEKAILDRQFHALRRHPDESGVKDENAFAAIREHKHQEERRRVIDRNPAFLHGFGASERHLRGFD